MSANRLAWAGSVAGLAAVAAVGAMLSTAASWQPPALVGILFVLGVLADRYELTSSNHMLVRRVAARLRARRGRARPGAGRGDRRRRDALPAAQAAQPERLAAAPARRRRRDLRRLPAHRRRRRRGRRPRGRPRTTSAWYAVVVAAAFLAAGALNYLLVAVFMKVVAGRPIRAQLVSTYVPLLSANLAQSVLVALIALLYALYALPAMLLSMLGLAVYIRLQGELLRPRQHARDARERAQRAGPDELRRAARDVADALAARPHDRAPLAAVARYAHRDRRGGGLRRERAGAGPHRRAAARHRQVRLPRRDPASPRSSPTSEWETIKRHPEQGARSSGSSRATARSAKIILAHHERIDGKGYPNGLAAEEIPRLARMISVADTYDVMTARDSYRRPVAHEEAIAELRRVSGAQLDGELVEIFITKVLRATGVAFGHGDDVDFEAELALVERRSHAEPYAVARPAQPAPAAIAA